MHANSFSLETSVVGTRQEQHPLVLQQGPERCDTRCAIPTATRKYLQGHFAHTWSWKLDTGSRLYNTCIIEIERDCLILNLCLQSGLCKDKALPSASTAIYYRDRVQIPLALFCLCQNCRTFHLSSFHPHTYAFRLQTESRTFPEQCVRTESCRNSFWVPNVLLTKGAQQGSSHNPG